MLSLNNALNTLRIQPSFANSAETAQDSSLKEFLAVQRGKAFFIFLDVVRKILASTVTSIFGFKNQADKTELKEIEPENLGTEFDALWVKFSKDYKFAFERDQEFLNWRYNNPEAEYRAYIVTREKKVVGYVVISLEEKSVTVGRLRFSGLKIGYIVDLVAEKALVVPLISAAEDELKKQGAFIAECWAADGSFSFETLRTGRYCQLPDEMYKVYFVASVHAPQLKASISPEYSKEILLSPGDSDIV